jgi:hypothetical protein
LVPKILIIEGKETRFTLIRDQNMMAYQDVDSLRNIITVSATRIILKEQLLASAVEVLANMTRALT